MPPQFISFGPLTLNLYTVLIALAVLAPLAWAWLQARDGRIFTVALVAACFALAFGRAGYVALNWDYFREHTNEILSLAGLSEHGAIAGGVIAYCVLRLASRVSRPASQSLNSQFSIFNFQFILVGIAASIGCIPNGCAYGREVFWQTDGEHSLAWLLHADWPDAYSISNPRWPTQMFMAGWLAVAGASWAVLTRGQGDRETRRQGDRETRYNYCYPVPLSPLLLVTLSFAVGDFLIQFLRGDPAPVLAGLRIYQWFDLALLAFATALLILGTRRP
ncbi:MAG: prolipoprotein diacylglyceryl transferase [Anaerolineae bacterium]|nr:prolipoprotein diacylglyceryl transferase [Candidatus Roseilinea sp.]MDW8448534.1 prolipoprotein diacylglyceryl transferase [Anaerolineae bacterium]